MNKVKTIFWEEIGALEKRADISKTRDKIFFAMYLRLTKF